MNQLLHKDWQLQELIPGKPKFGPNRISKNILHDIECANVTRRKSKVERDLHRGPLVVETLLDLLLPFQSSYLQDWLGETCLARNLKGQGQERFSVKTEPKTRKHEIGR